LKTLNQNTLIILPLAFEKIGVDFKNIDNQ